MHMHVLPARQQGTRNAHQRRAEEEAQEPGATQNPDSHSPYLKVNKHIAAPVC